MTESQMIHHIASDAAQIAQLRKQVPPKMPAGKGIQAEEQSVEHEDPGEEQVPLPSHGQPFAARNRRPGRERSNRSSREAEHPGGVERMAQHGGDPFDLASLHPHGFDGQNRPIAVRTLAPIERLMRVENLKSGHDENGEADDVEPMSETNRNGMPVD